jgi:hypothetical protein
MNPYEHRSVKPKETVKTVDVESLTPEELYRQLSKSFVFIRIKH